MKTDKGFRMFYYSVSYAYDVLCVVGLWTILSFSYFGQEQLMSSFNMSTDLYLSVWRKLGIDSAFDLQHYMQLFNGVFVVITAIGLLLALTWDIIQTKKRGVSANNGTVKTNNKKTVVVASLLFSVYVAIGLISIIGSFWVLRQSGGPLGQLALLSGRYVLETIMILCLIWLAHNVRLLLIGSKYMKTLVNKEAKPETSGSFVIVSKKRAGSRHKRTQKQAGWNMTYNVTVRPRYHWRSFIVTVLLDVRSENKRKQAPVIVTVSDEILTDEVQKQTVREERVKRYEERKAHRTHSDRKVLKAAKRKTVADDVGSESEKVKSI